jgi:hypothetical protein
VGGRRDEVHLALRHTSGAASSASLSLTAPAGLHEITFWGESGLVRFVPDVDAVAAYGAAIDALLSGDTRFDARFGLEVVRVLAEVESALGGS